MDTVQDVLSDKDWPIPTQEPTVSIGLSFIFLAYFLHPRIEAAYQRVRAARAWRAVQKHERVDVTDYPMFKEAFGVRGVWDAARVVTLLLMAFSLVSWVLELSLGIYHINLEAYLLTTPPAVFKKTTNEGGLEWKVQTLEEMDLEYDREWLKLPGMSEFQANSRYYVKDYQEFAWSKKTNTYKSGEIVVASWDPEDRPSLFYGPADTVTVKELGCTHGGEPKGSVMYDGEEWGDVLECGEGPQVSGQNESSQPAIILSNNSTGVSVVVEEVGTHPSFLYSVWTAANASSVGAPQVNLTYAFHISSTVRLAEAVVTGIVHGETDGGGCFGLLRAFSRGSDNEDTDTPINAPPDDTYERATPFGEKPKDSKVDSLQDVETLEGGVLMTTNALVAFVCLLLLSLVGIGWSVCLKSAAEMDIFDRNELLRVISQQALGEANDPSANSKMRIYVQKERQGDQLSVMVSESDDDHNCCMRFLLRKEPTASVHPVPAADTMRNALDDHGGARLPQGRPCMLVGGSMRYALGRTFPGRDRNFRYPLSATSSVALSASPVPSALPTPINSNAGSATGTPAPRGLWARRGNGLTDANISSPIPSIAGSNSAAATPAPPDSGSATETQQPLRSPRSPGFLPSFGGFGKGGGGCSGGVGGGGARGVGYFGVSMRGASVLFESGYTLGDGDDGNSAGETDGDGSADTEMGSGPLARGQVAAFGGDAGGDMDVEMGSGASSRPKPSFVRDTGGDVEMGNLELVRPKLHAFASDPGRPDAQGQGSLTLFLFLPTGRLPQQAPVRLLRHPEG
eukprot:g16431.t1